MGELETTVLTDVETDLYLESWSVSSKDFGATGANNWSVAKRRLRGGLSDGVDVIDVDNGALSFTVVPTRGMGIWRGRYRGLALGWKSPARGPVHPAFVNPLDRGGIGWVAGFDEWIVRCGLNSNGAPCVDSVPDNQGNMRDMVLPLHGRIANLPAHRVEVRIEKKPPHAMEIAGIVDEAVLFFPQLRLSSVVRTFPGSNQMIIEDAVTNLASQPAEMQLLYHCNFGPPLLEEGARLEAPVRLLAPRDPHAAKEIDQALDYPAPIPGVVESAFWMSLAADEATDMTLAMLRNRSGSAGCALRFSTAELPWFTMWKNPGDLRDGYVTGLEPGTNLPNARKFEREKGRVILLQPGETRRFRLAFELLDTREDVAKLSAEIRSLARNATPLFHRQPQRELSALS